VITASARDGVRLRPVVFRTEIESCYTDSEPTRVLSLFHDGKVLAARAKISREIPAGFL
jgi:hypothetical protein